MTDFHKNVRTALVKQCEAVNVSIDEIDFTDEGERDGNRWIRKPWFMQHSWTQQQEADYCEWWCDFVKKNWKGIMMCKPYSHKQIATAWQYWNLNCGWTTKKECK